MATLEQVKTQAVQPVTLKEMVRAATLELGKALPTHMNPERVVRIALTALNQNPELTKCTPHSFMGSLFILAQIGLEPIAGRAYLLPFNNKRKIGNEWKTVKEVQAVIGYRGLTELFYRHESSVSIDMQTVYTNDEFDYRYGTQPYLNHKPADTERGVVRGYYAVALLRGGGTLFKYLPQSDCMAHGRKHSKTFNKQDGIFHPSSPWSSDPDSMCKKTVIIQLAKVLPLSVELHRAIAVDETSRDYRDGLKNAFEAPETTTWTDEEPTQIEGPMAGKPSEYQEGPNGEIIE